MDKIGRIVKKAIVIFLGTFFIVSTLGIFKIQDKDAFQAWDSFYSEKKDSLDVIYIGASNVYPFWSAPVYWKETGHTVFPLSISSMPSRAIKYVIEEAVKTQPNAHYIVCLNNFKSGYRKEPASIHYLCDYMKMSSTKFHLIEALTQDAEIQGFDKLEFFLPFVRFHSRWSDLSKKDYILKNNDIKNAIITSNSLSQIKDVSGNYRITANTVDYTDQQIEILDELLDYCEGKNIKLLFTIVPQAINNESVIGQMNSLSNYIINRGHDVIDLLSDYDEIGLQLNQDFYNNNHVNVHGALKFTRYLGKFLDNYYNLPDNRENANYDSWNKSYNNYVDIIKKHTLDIEINNEERDYSLKIPTISSCSPNNEGIVIKWNSVDKATGYAIYRKTKNNKTGILSAWTRIGVTDKVSYLDSSAVNESTSYYTVVPFREEDSKILYGNFNYNGESTSFNIKAPILKTFSTDFTGNTITWNSVKGASGYKVYRQINNQKWIEIADVKNNENELKYTDTYFQKNLPYLYSVSAYYYDSDNNIKESDIDRQGFLYNEQGLEDPKISLTKADDNSRILEWSSVKGANYYTLYRKQLNGEWELVKDNIKQNITQFIDNDQSINYYQLEYKLTAVLTYKDTKYEYDSNIVSMNVKGD